MKVLILGGTGAMGTPLVKLCLDAGYETFVTTRKDKKSDNERLHYIIIDAHSSKFEEYVRDKSFDSIIDFMVYTEAELQKRIDLLLSCTKQYCFLSSARVFDNAEVINEESPRLLDFSSDEEYLATSEYSLAKAREENILFAAANKNWTIIRPYITYNDERLQFGFFEKEDWLFRAVNGKTVVLPADLMKKNTTLTFGGDVAYCIFKLIGHPGAVGECFNVTSDEHLTWKSVLDCYSVAFEKVYGYKMKYKLVGNKDTYSNVFKSKRYQINYCRMFNRVFDNGKCHSCIEDDFQFTRIADGLELCLRQFKKKNSPFKSINPYAQAFFDRKTHEFTPINSFQSLKHKLMYICSRFAPMSYNVYARLFHRLIDDRANGK